MTLGTPVAFEEDGFRCGLLTKVGRTHVYVVAWHGAGRIRLVRLEKSRLIELKPQGRRKCRGYMRTLASVGHDNASKQAWQHLQRMLKEGYPK